MSDWQEPCPTCGQGDFKTALAFAGHQRSKGHPNYVGSSPTPEEFSPTTGAVLIKVPGAERVYGARGTGYRTIKMGAARCLECQARFGDTPGWWYKCLARGHNPYFSADRFEDREKQEWGETLPDGTQRAQGTSEKYRVRIPGGPNIVCVPYTGRHNGDFNTAMRKARGKGRVLLEEIGVAPMCQYSESGRDCYYQGPDLKSYGDMGQYCCVDHYKAVAQDQRLSGKFPEVLNDRKKREVWESIPVPQGV
jgi:hypothetical protein